MNDEHETPTPDTARGVVRRPVRSYVLRNGRTTTGQTQALQTLGPRWRVPYSACPVDLATLFDRPGPTTFEIGFGMGEATAQIAQSLPDRNFLACEVHEAGVGALLRRIDDLGLANLRLVQHDAIEVLTHMVAPGALAAVHLYFPDPWHKTRHHKRRIVQAPFARLVADRLHAGGILHCATDWQPYAAQMLEVLRAEPALENTVEAYAPRPEWRPLTKFERRGLRLGHGVWDLVFRRR